MTTTTGQPADIRLAATLALTAAMAAAAIALGFLLPSAAQPGAAFSLGIPAITAIAVASELAAVDRRIGPHNHTLSLSEVGLIIGLAFAAPTELVLGRVIAGLIVYGAIKRIPAPKLAFNTALFALESAVAASVFRTLIGDRTVHEPAAWIALTVALVAATAIGLGAVRAVLKIHGAQQDPNTLIFSVAITGAAITIGIIAVVGLSFHTETALLIIVLCAIAVTAMRTIETLTHRTPIRD